MKIILKQQLDKFWLKTELFIPDEDLKYKTMLRMNELFDDWFSFVVNFENIEEFPSFDKVFLSEDFYDYLKLVKNELKAILQEVEKTEQLTGIFTGLLGHEMSFGYRKENYLDSSYEKKEFIMLHTLKLMEIAYYEQFQVKLPLPKEYRDWIKSQKYDWEFYVKDLN